MSVISHSHPVKEPREGEPLPFRDEKAEAWSDLEMPRIDSGDEQSRDCVTIINTMKCLFVRS